MFFKDNGSAKFVVPPGNVIFQKQVLFQKNGSVHFVINGDVIFEENVVLQNNGSVTFEITGNVIFEKEVIFKDRYDDLPYDVNFTINKNVLFKGDLGFKNVRNVKFETKGNALFKKDLEFEENGIVKIDVKGYLETNTTKFDKNKKLELKIGKNLKIKEIIYNEKNATNITIGTLTSGNCLVLGSTIDKDIDFEGIGSLTITGNAFLVGKLIVQNDFKLTLKGDTIYKGEVEIQKSSVQNNGPALFEDKVKLQNKSTLNIIDKAIFKKKVSTKGNSCISYGEGSTFPENNNKDDNIVKKCSK